MSENNFQEKINVVIDSVSDVVDTVNDKAKELASEVVAASETPEEAVDAADKVVETAEEPVSDVAEETVEAVEDEVKEQTEDVVDDVKAAESGDAAEEEAEEVSEAKEEPETETAGKLPDMSDMSLAQLSELFGKLKAAADAMNRSKEAEAIKVAFYKLLNKLKGENPEEDGDSRKNPFDSVEQNFKAMYADYKQERAEFNRKQDEIRKENQQKKEQIIEELKALVEGQDDMSAHFPEFRDIQNRWREAGPVPNQSFREINDRYQFYVEKFYDNVKISRDLRELDFKKNLEVKQGFCEMAEKLAESEDVVDAFHELQKLHEQWKEYGPVAKEYRESIWNRFKAATAVVNKRYQAHFEGMKEQQLENLEKKKVLCEKVEALAARSDINSSSEWNKLSKEVEAIQAEWRTIGFATKKENQKIYDRFRAACDAFYLHKRNFYSEARTSMAENVEKKQALIEQAEALKDSTDWKKTTDQYISLQKQWKEIGPVPRKKSEQMWKRFRAACDEFFAKRDANAGPEKDFYSNLKAKRKLIAEVKAYVPTDNETANADAMRNFNERWQAIGHVPYKDKEKVYNEFNSAMTEKFPLFSSSRRSAGSRAPRSQKDILIAKYNSLQQNIITYENNIGFFANSKSSEPFIKQMQARIDEAKAELRKLEEQIRKSEDAE